jgi:BNR-Asp box repeat
MTPLLSPFRRVRPLQVALLTLGVLSSSSICLSQAQAPASGVASNTALPSGLSPVYHLVVGGSQLSLDGNGDLYRSEDQGKHWHQIKPQWDGKAVELLGIPALTTVPGSGQAPKSSTDQDSYAAVLLKSTTALHWVSVDRGKTWKPSTLDDVRRNDVHWSGPVTASSLGCTVLPDHSCP